MAGQKKVVASADKEPKHESLLGILEEKEIKYHLLTPDERGSVRSYLRAALLKDEKGYLMILLASDRILDYPELCRCLYRDLEYVEPEDGRWLDNYDKVTTSYPAIANLLKTQYLLDSNLSREQSEDGQIVMATGNMGGLVSIDYNDFELLHKDVWEASISIDAFKLKANPTSEDISERKINNVSGMFTLRRMQSRVKETFEMPVMPSMADELLKLRVDPAANSTSLARLVEKDPSLSAQLISWACSPYYGYPGKITSIDDAIIKVLGYDLVMNIALGIAIGKVMRISYDGPLGLRAYWLHSIYSATLVEKIVGSLSLSVPVYRGMAYLCGLLHNFGHLLLGHVFPPQFFALNNLVALNPNIEIIKLENFLLSIDHQALGTWLMQAWHMPEELIITVGYHHHADYDGKHAAYPKLVQIANYLLKSKGLGDEFMEEFPYEHLKYLGLDKQDLINVFEDFWQHNTELDGVIKILSN